MTFKEKLEALKGQNRCMCGSSDEKILTDKEIDDIINLIEE